MTKIHLIHWTRFLMLNHIILAIKIEHQQVLNRHNILKYNTKVGYMVWVFYHNFNGLGKLLGMAFEMFFQV